MALVLGYATLMNPRVFSRFGNFDYDLVWLLNHQRFFGVVNLSGRTLDSVFGNDGNLVDRNVGITTIVPDHIHRINAVLYRNVPDNVLDNLDRFEAEANMTRRIVDETLLIHFEDLTRAYPIPDDPVFTYVTKDEIDFLDEKKIQLVRNDVRPDLVYLKLCREAAGCHGRQFRQAYDETTFLARRRTRLSETAL